MMQLLGIFHLLFHYKSRPAPKTNSITLIHNDITPIWSFYIQSLMLSCDRTNASKSSNLSSAYLLSQLHCRESKQWVSDWREMFWSLCAGWDQPKESQEQPGHEDQQEALHTLSDCQSHCGEIKNHTVRNVKRSAHMPLPQQFISIDAELWPHLSPI